MNVEYAGGAFPGDARLTRGGVVARAPEWWRKLANTGLRSAAAAKSSAPVTPARRFAGWIYGVACCGVSQPAYSSADGKTLREQFTPAAFADMVKQSMERSIPLTLGHGGRTLTESGRTLDLLFRVHDLYGLCFEARLTDTPFHRQVLEDLERGVLGVSIGYVNGKGWTTERDGFGTIRVIGSARLDHVALLPRDSKQSPAYRACWASGVRGNRLGVPTEVRQAAQRKAYAELIRQAKATG